TANGTIGRNPKILSLTGLSVTIDLTVTYQLSGTTFSNFTVTGGTLRVQATSATLFPDATANTIVSGTAEGIDGRFDYAVGGSTLKLKANTLKVKVGKLLEVTATNVEFDPKANPIATASTFDIDVPGLNDLGGGTRLETGGFRISPTAITFDHVRIQFPGKISENATPRLIEVEDLEIEWTNLVFTYPATGPPVRAGSV